MTGRERLVAVLNKKPTDRLPWTTLVDRATLSHCPEELQDDGGIPFYGYIGCDIFLLNGWNTPYSFRSPELRWPESVEVNTWQKDGVTYRQWNTSKGTLTAAYRNGHPVKYPVETIHDILIYREMWEGASFVAHDDFDTLAALNNLIGEDGIVTRFWGPSTIPRLLEEDMGTEHFYYLFHDHPYEMEGLVHCIHDRELEAFRHLADGPWSSATLCENTSTYYISPEVYAKYNMLHQRDFVEMIQHAGKTAILHMCGHVHALLELIRETGCDGIHALTPPPTGDTPWEDALDVLGEDLIIIGCLDPSIFIRGDIEDIGPTLDQCITPRLQASNFVLALGADGIPVPMERFLAVKRWMEKHTLGRTT